MVSLDNRVQRLCESARELNSHADKITDHIKRLEVQIREAGVGIVFYSDKPAIWGDDAKFYLGWDCGDEGWGFHYYVKSDSAPFEPEARRLLKAKRAFRVSLYRGLGELVDTLQEHILNEAEELSHSLADLEKAVANQEARS